MKTDVTKRFSDVFGGEPEAAAFAPGRVNLIGEHTDYNGGFVLPCALDLGIWGAARRRDDRKLRFFSAQFPGVGVVETSLDTPISDGFAAYPVGVIRTFAAMGYPLERGADFAFCGDLPDGAGLSSSAAIEVLTGLLLRTLYGFAVTAQQLAVFGQFAENRFVGVRCGIMDQFASAMGKKDHAILLNTETLSYTYAPFFGRDVSLVLVGSGVKHSLAASAYNDRRRECESALIDLSGATKAPSLCSLTPGEFEKINTHIADPVCRRRARHAVYESDRTVAAAKAMQSGDLAAFSELMRQSHLSLRDDYEVSCAELDFLAETAWETDGVYGARMTGGGFGGCTVNLVATNAVPRFTERIKRAYQDRFGKEPAVYTVGIGDGAHTV